MKTPTKQGKSAKKEKKEIVLNHDKITNNLTLYIFMIHDGTTQKSIFKNMFNSNDFERKCLRICFQKNEF